jgi:hypothetical protein
MPIWCWFLTLQCHPVLELTDKPAPTPPRQPLRLPANFRDMTAEKIGTVIGIVGATAATATKPG